MFTQFNFTQSMRNLNTIQCMSDGILILRVMLRGYGKIYPWTSVDHITQFNIAYCNGG